MPLLTYVMQFIMTMFSHLPDIRSWAVFPVTVVVPVHKTDFWPETNK